MDADGTATREGKALRFAHMAMRTEFSIYISGEDWDCAESATATVFRVLDSLEGKLSRFIASSDVARVNALGAGESFCLGSAAWECLVIAAELAAATGRAFDPACGALIDFWKARAMAPVVPLAELENEAVWQAAWETHRLGEISLLVDTHEVLCVTPGGKLDLGAIGKGFALDAMARVLEEEWGISRALLSAGGSTVLALDAPEGKPGWKIGFGAESGLPLVPLARQALSSSGVGVQKTHLVDPRTGGVVRRDDVVRARAPSGAVADALSTAFFVMSREEVLAYCAAHPDHMALFVEDDGTGKKFVS